MAVAYCVGQLYYLNTVTHKSAITVDQNKLNLLWHRRLGHIGNECLTKMIRTESVNGLDSKHCCNGKMNKTPFPISNKKNCKPLDLIHTDVCGKITPNSRGNNSYFLTFIDHATRYSWVYVIAHKSDVFQKFLEWKSICLLYTSPSPRDKRQSRMPSSA